MVVNGFVKLNIDSKMFSAKTESTAQYFPENPLYISEVEMVALFFQTYSYFHRKSEWKKKILEHDQNEGNKSKREGKNDGNTVQY